MSICMIVTGAVAAAQVRQAELAQAQLDWYASNYRPDAFVEVTGVRGVLLGQPVQRPCECKGCGAPLTRAEHSCSYCRRPR